MLVTELAYAPNQIVSSQWSSVTPIYGVSSTLRKSQRKIAELSRLSVNWDTYGSCPIQPAAIERALKILSLADRHGFTAPDIFPVPGGGIQLEWQNEKRELELEILPDATLEYLTVDENKNMEEDRLSAQPDFEILNLLRWFKG